jgi:hypothetical protein
MKKKWIGWGIGVVILILGLFLGDVQIQFGTYSPQASAKIVRAQLTKIQDIS